MGIFGNYFAAGKTDSTPQPMTRLEIRNDDPIIIDEVSKITETPEIFEIIQPLEVQENSIENVNTQASVSPAEITEVTIENVSTMGDVEGQEKIESPVENECELIGEVFDEIFPFEKFSNSIIACLRKDRSVGAKKTIARLYVEKIKEDILNEAMRDKLGGLSVSEVKNGIKTIFEESDMALSYKREEKPYEPNEKEQERIVLTMNEFLNNLEFRTDSKKEKGVDDADLKKQAAPKTETELVIEPKPESIVLIEPGQITVGPTEIVNVKNPANSSNQDLLKDISVVSTPAITREGIKNSEQKEKKNENKERLFEKAIERVDKIKNIRIKRIGRGEEGIKAIEITDVTDVKVQNMQKEEKNKLATHIKRANGAIVTAQEELTKEKKSLAEKVETKDENIETKPEDGEDKNKIIAEQFRTAAGLVEKSALSCEEFEGQYGIKLSENAPLSFDAQKELLRTAGIIEGHHEDAFDKKKGAEFRQALALLFDAVEKINNPSHPNKMVVIEELTYFVAKDIKKVEPGIVELKESKTENKEALGMALELARDFRGHLVDALKNDEGWKKRRKEYRESFLEGEVVAFLDELLEQENIVTDDKKEAFIKDVLNELASV